MFVFIKKVFQIGSLFLSSLVMLIAMKLHFILLVLKQVNVAAFVIILMIHMQKYVFPML